MSSPRRAVLLSLALSGLLACAASRSAEPASQAPQHVMSLSLCTDTLLLELLPLNRIASVTYFSLKPSNSFLWQQASKVPINYGGAEEVFAQKPDFVLAGTYSTPATRMLIKKAGIPMLEVPPANDFEEIRAITRSVAHALGQAAVGEGLIAKMDTKLRELDATKPRRIIRVAGWNGGGSVPGKGTLFDSILTAAGGVNVAAEEGVNDNGFDLEQLLRTRPDVLAYGDDATTSPGLNTDRALHPVILKLYAGRRISFPSALYSCGLVQSADAAVALRASLLEAVASEH